MINLLLAGSEEEWCDETSGNCQECGGYWINPDDLNGCFPMWNECTSTAECCGDAECLEDRIGWKHCNTAANLVLPDTCCSWDQGFCKLKQYTFLMKLSFSEMTHC